ncbi:MAG: amidohydrolase family protein [Phycisphaerae bacterium]|nr:amidohydrolase family protein [Phycisphaerae bacterium]
MKAYVILLSFLLLMPASAKDEQPEIMAIKAGKILTMSGSPITDGVILIKDGKITDIGTGIEIPEKASVIDAGKKVVMPGLVDASAAPPVRGDLNEEYKEITPTIRISTALDPQSKVLKRIVQTGITTLYISPGWRNVIAGLGAVIKPTGKTPKEMIIKEDAALTLVMSEDSLYGNQIPRSQPPRNFYFRRPTTRMAIIWMLRKSFFDTQEYVKAGEKDDPDLEILASALDDKIPVRLNVRRAINIRTALKLAEEYDFQLILDECTEGYKVAEEIAEKKISVVLGPFYYYPRNLSQYEGREVNWNNAGILTKAGVKVALTSGAQAQSIDLLTATAFAVRHGMPKDEALKAVTITPAEILGVADKVGTLEKGKDADILILSGDPLKVTTRIEKVILNGKTVYKAE